MGKEIFATHLRAIIRFRMKECLPKLYELSSYLMPYDKLTEFFTKITIDTIDYRIKNNIFRPDFLNILLELKKNPEKIPDIGMCVFSNFTTVSNELYTETSQIFNSICSRSLI